VIGTFGTSRDSITQLMTPDTEAQTFFSCWTPGRSCDGERGEHDAQVRVDGFALVVVDRPCGEVVFGHPKRCLDPE
jgi:hypothetical protein